MKLLRHSVLALALASQGAAALEVMTPEPAASPAYSPTQAQALQAASIARANTGGRVLDVRPLQNETPSAYRVRLLIDPGRVRTVIVDADSGLVR